MNTQNILAAAAGLVAGYFAFRKTDAAVGAIKISPNDLFIAEVFGNAAHKNGIERIPVRDKEFIEWMGNLNLNIGEGGVQLMKAWYEGWDVSNLNS